MPITYEQPAPFASSISEAYGGAQAYQQMSPELIRQQDELARINQQGMQSNQQAFEQQQQRIQQQQLQDQKFQNQQQLAQMDFTHADGLRLQQLQQGMAAVQDAVGNGTLSEDEGNDMMLRIKTGIDPLQQRMERTRQKALQQQSQLQMDQHARQTAMDDAAASALKEPPMEVRDDDGNLTGHIYLKGFTPTGRPTYGHMAVPKGEKDTSAADAAKAQQAEDKMHSDLTKHYTDVATKTLYQEMTDHNKRVHDLAPKTAGPDGKSTVNIDPADLWGPPNQEDIQKRADDYINRHYQAIGKTRPRQGGAQAPASLTPGQPAPAPPTVQEKAAKFGADVDEIMKRSMSLDTAKPPTDEDMGRESSIDADEVGRLVSESKSALDAEPWWGPLKYGAGSVFGKAPVPPAILGLIRNAESQHRGLTIDERRRYERFLADVPDEGLRERLTPRVKKHA